MEACIIYRYDNSGITEEVPVVDGTKCGYDTHDMCVNGECFPAGCDNVLYSNATIDVCGICNGNNSTCKRTKGSMEKAKNSEGYHEIVTIPIGSVLVDIQCTPKKNNYLGTF